MKNLIKILKNNKGFSLVEMVVSMALLVLIMSISINVMSIVGKVGKKVDYQINVAQESLYASERLKRLVRSADILRSWSEDSISLSVGGEDITLEFKPLDPAASNPEEFYLKENGSSIISSDVIIKKLIINEEAVDFFEPVLEDGSIVGMKVSFIMVDVDDEKELSGAVIVTQGINRSLILNK